MCCTVTVLMHSHRSLHYLDLCPPLPRLSSWRALCCLCAKSAGVGDRGGAKSTKKGSVRLSPLSIDFFLDLACFLLTSPSVTSVSPVCVRPFSLPTFYFARCRCFLRLFFFFVVFRPFSPFRFTSLRVNVSFIIIFNSLLT